MHSSVYHKWSQKCRRKWPDRTEEAVVFRMRRPVFASILCLSILYCYCADRRPAPLKLESVDQDSRTNKVVESFVPAVYMDSDTDHVIECGYNFSSLDTKNLGTPYSNSGSNQSSNSTPSTAAGDYSSPASTNSTSGYSTPAPTTTGSSGWSSNSGSSSAPASGATDNSSTSTPTSSSATPRQSGGGFRGALHSIKQTLQNNLQNNLRQTQNNGTGLGAGIGPGVSPAPAASPYPIPGLGVGSAKLYTPAPDGFGTAPAVPTVMKGYGGVPQMMPQGYGVTVHPGAGMGDLGPDMDQDVMKRHYEEMKRREAAGGMMNPVMSDIMKNSTPAQRAKYMQMYQQQHAAPLPSGQEPSTPEEMVKVAVYIEREQQISKLPQALEYYKKAAEAGYGPGMCLLADRYQYGIKEVLKPDPDKAFYWWSKAAGKGERVALFAMGSYYLNGEHVPKNQTKSFQYFLQSAQKGYNEAKLVVGQAYVCGEGVAENRQEALKWLEDANNGGSPEAGSWLFMLKLKNCPAHFANRQAFLNYGYTADATWKANQAAGGNANNARIRAIQTPYGSMEHTRAVNQLRTNTEIEQRTREQLNTQF
jgi:TPR repeat protein